ncbi:MAG: HNH endonuclease [Gemmatimonadaceae bacterium]|nr:HNH endonuclease [Gemmatimonadaceae bacterium]
MNRGEIFGRDEWRCVYCGVQCAPAALTIDHVQPLLRGGDSSGGNVVTACSACNLRKGHRRLAEFLLDEPEALASFRARALHVWPRHLRALDEAIAAEQRRRETAHRGPSSR